MTAGALVNEPGYFILTLDGDSYRLPKSLQPEETLRIMQADLASGGVSVLGIFAGDGLPNVLSSLRIVMPWDTDDTVGDLTEQLEMLAASGVVHDLAYWKQRVLTYTLSEGQQVIYLPRRDAYAAGYSGFDVAGNKLVAAVNGGAALTTVYQSSVAEDDAIPSGEIWVSETAIDHPDTRKANVVRCKLGDAAAAGDELVVKFMPLYSVMVVEAKTEFTMTGREDKTFTFVEVD